MKKYIIFFSISWVILASLVALVIRSRTEHDRAFSHYDDLCVACMEKRGNEIQELYQLFDAHIIEAIGQDSGPAPGKNEIDIEYNGNRYFVDLPGLYKQENKEDCTKACEIVDNLMENYSIIHISFNGSYMQMELLDTMNDRAYALVYQNPAISQPHDIYKRYYFKKIGAGFYFEYSLTNSF